MVEQTSQPHNEGMLYKFFEISLGFAVTLVIVGGYIAILFWLYSLISPDTIIPYKDTVILAGAIGGAVSIILSSSIRKVGYELSNIKPDIDIYLTIPSGEECYGYTFPDEEESDDKEEDGKKKEKIISYDFNYV